MINMIILSQEIIFHQWVVILLGSSAFAPLVDSTCAAEARAPCGAKHRDVKGPDAIRLVDASATCWIIAGCTRIRRTFPRITNERPRLNGLRLFGGPEPRATTCRQARRKR